MEWLIFVLLIIIGCVFAVEQQRGTRLKVAICILVVTIVTGLAVSIIWKNLEPVIDYKDSSSEEESTSEGQNGKKTEEGSDTQETTESLNYIEDVTNVNAFEGSIYKENQADRYKYVVATEGTYRFETDLSSGGKVTIRILGENDEIIDSGTNTLSTDLEAGKTYIISIEEYSGSCDYTVKIGVPNPVKEITGISSVSGEIVYQDQMDCYVFKTTVGGTYRFDTNLSAGGNVRIRISGENNNSLSYGTNGLTFDMEAEKVYVLSVEYKDGPCSYEVNIGVPKKSEDISNSRAISGAITYKDQKDRYYYTASISGTYRFDTDLSAGGEVRIRVSGENGNSLGYANNAISFDMEAGKTYIVSIEYRHGSCSYTVNIGIPNRIKDISGSASFSGSITYKDQKDRYRYSVHNGGMYQFNANLSAGGSVRIRVSGENGNSISYGRNTLKINLEAGKTYIISVEYVDEPCDYVVTMAQ